MNDLVLFNIPIYFSNKNMNKRIFKKTKKEINLLLFIIVFFFSFVVFSRYTLAANLSITSAASNYQIGDIFNVIISLDTNGSTTDGVDIHYLHYNPTILEVQDSDTGTSGVQILPGTLLANTLTNSVDSTNGLIDFSQISSGGADFNGSGTLATISFKALAAGTTTLSFDFALASTTDCNVASQGSDILNSVNNLTIVVSTPAPKTCQELGGTCQSHPCSSYSSCSGISGTCTSGYCCTGSCIVVSSGGGGGGGGGYTPPPIDTTPPNKVSNFIVHLNGSNVNLSWDNPTNSDFSTVSIYRYSTSSSISLSNSKISQLFAGCPSNCQNQLVSNIYQGNAKSFTDTDVASNNEGIYYAIYARDNSANYSEGVYSGVTQHANATSSGNNSSSNNQLVNQSVGDKTLTGQEVLMRAIGDTKVYVISQGKRRWIRTAETFIHYGYDWGAIQEVSPETISSYPEGEPLFYQSVNFDQYSLLKAVGNPKVYLIVSGKKILIPNISAFQLLGLKWSNLREVKQTELNKYSRAKFIKAKDKPQVYYITQSGLKRHIINPDVFVSYPGNKWSDILEVPPVILDIYPNNVLIKKEGSSKVYFIKGNKKHWIPSPEVFNNHHFDWQGIASVNETEINAYETSSPLS